MENVITVKNMRESDEFTINTSVSGQELMRRAAQGVFDNVLWKGSVAITAVTDMLSREYLPTTAFRPLFCAQAKSSRLTAHITISFVKIKV